MEFLTLSKDKCSTYMCVCVIYACGCPPLSDLWVDCPQREGLAGCDAEQRAPCAQPCSSQNQRPTEGISRPKSRPERQCQPPRLEGRSLLQRACAASHLPPHVLQEHGRAASAGSAADTGPSRLGCACLRFSNVFPQDICGPRSPEHGENILGTALEEEEGLCEGVQRAGGLRADELRHR